jgi:hypothetical protein
LIKGLLAERAQLFTQPVALDGCSLAEHLDSAAFASVAGTPGLVRGKPGQCEQWTDQETAVILYVHEVSDNGGDFVPKSLPRRVRSDLHTVALDVRNPRSGESHFEEWAIRLTPFSTPAVVAMRMSSIGVVR